LFVVLNAGVDAPALRSSPEPGLAAQKLPERWEVVDALPRTGSGKIRKGELTERFR
jgi:acyl-CoA synthetase (AMP-forming)/AMP-acid ligase II